MELAISEHVVWMLDHVFIKIIAISFVTQSCGRREEFKWGRGNGETKVNELR